MSYTGRENFVPTYVRAGCVGIISLTWGLKVPTDYSQQPGRLESNFHQQNTLDCVGTTLLCTKAFLLLWIWIVSYLASNVWHVRKKIFWARNSRNERGILFTFERNDSFESKSKRVFSYLQWLDSHQWWGLTIFMKYKNCSLRLWAGRAKYSLCNRGQGGFLQTDTES